MTTIYTYSELTRLGFAIGQRTFFFCLTDKLPEFTPTDLKDLFDALAKVG